MTGTRTRTYRWVLCVLATLLVVGVTAQPAAASVSMAADVVQEPGDHEARFPDVVKLNDGRLMAVWHRTTEHSGTAGTIQLSFGSSNGWPRVASPRAAPLSAVVPTPVARPARLFVIHYVLLLRWTKVWLGSR